MALVNENEGIQRGAVLPSATVVRSIEEMADKETGQFIVRSLATLAAVGAMVGLAVAACASPSETTSVEILPTPTATATATPVPPSATPSPSPAPTLPRPTRVGLTPVAPATPLATPTPTPSPTLRFHDIAEIPEPPDADLVDLVQRFRDIAPGAPLLAPDPGDEVLEAGRVDAFSVLDLNEEVPYTVQAELKYVSPHAYWYFDVGQDEKASELESIAARFEDEVYAVVTGALGTEWEADPSPGQRIVLLHTPIEGAAGYYSSKDDFSTEVHPDSNERKILYLDTALRPGSDLYYGTVAHELQHAIHRRADRTEETWVNEGMAEVARGLTGRSLLFAESYLRAPESSVVHWARSPKSPAPNYGAAGLFLSYLVAHHGGEVAARGLLEEQADGIAGVEAYLEDATAGVSFDQVFQDWSVATLLDLEVGPYSYPDIDLPPPAIATLGREQRARTFTVPQYGVTYVKLEGDLLVFEGAETVEIAPHEQGCWWSNSGDSIHTSLTRSFNLDGASEATLELRLWYDIEMSWDYAYVTASSDGGLTWEILVGALGSPANPVGNAFGPGYTGATEEWVWDSVDLSRFAGGEVLVRLEYVTDEATTADGLCVSNVRIPELGYDYEASSGEGGWEAAGFFRVLGPLEQRYSVQVVAWDEERRHVGVQALPLDDRNRGRLDIAALRERYGEVVAVVIPMTRKTRGEATFDLIVE